MIILRHFIRCFALCITCIHTSFTMELQQSIGTQTSQPSVLETLAGATIEIQQRHIESLQRRLDLTDEQNRQSRKTISLLAEGSNFLLGELAIDREIAKERATITSKLETQINDLNLLLAIQAQDLTKYRTQLSTATFDQQEPPSKTDWHSKKFTHRKKKK